MDDFFAGVWTDHDYNGEISHTLSEQCECERECAPFLQPFKFLPESILKEWRDEEMISDSGEVKLLRRQHVAYLTNGITFPLSASFVSLDASRPWLCYWILHSMNLLGRPPTYIFSRVVSTLSKFQNPRGGYGGGPSQMAHCAPTYSAVLALCTIGSEEALRSIDRKLMYRFFLSLKTENGGLRMHEDGEVDTRGTYTVLAVARILNILTAELTEGVAEYLISCQTYEGGFGGEPWNEAHGGYNFCAIAGLCILGRGHDCDLDALDHWLRGRQMKLEGGFQGRTNKLVDACYSFWQAGAVVVSKMIRLGLADTFDADKVETATDVDTTDGIVELDGSGARIHLATEDGGGFEYNQFALQKYILQCGQTTKGGLRDKPSKGRDFYHSCYALSGLSIAQYYDLDVEGRSHDIFVYGDVDNVLARTSPVFNITSDKLKSALSFFMSSEMPCTHLGLIA